MMAGTVAVGMVAVVVAAPARSTISPSPAQWLLLLVLLAPVLLVPSALRRARHAVGATVLAASAGVGYALRAPNADAVPAGGAQGQAT